MILSKAVTSGPRNLGIAMPLLILLLGKPSHGGDLVCNDRNVLVGEAIPIECGFRADAPDWDRLDRLTDIARNVYPESRDIASVSKSLRITGERAMGRLSAIDRYWLGTAWWAMHQPAVHLKYPRWAPEVPANPNLALTHREGGNCESSANAHAALLVYLGIPSRAVYGHLLPSGEGHVWTLSDVGGRPLAADVHLARANMVQRAGIVPWHPSAAQIQVVSSWQAAKRFLKHHRPEEARLSGLAQ